MSEGLSLKLVSDGVTPVLKKCQQLGLRPRPLLQAMGNTFLSITKGNFNSTGAAMRPVPWKPKTDGTPSNLRKNGLLSASLHLDVTDQSATVGSPMEYAAIHQFGGVITPDKKQALHFQLADGHWVTVKSVTMPARPYFPVTAGGTRLTGLAETLIARAGERALMRQIAQ